MGKPGYGQKNDFRVGESEFRRSGEVVDDVLSGKQVSPNTISRAGEALVSALWRGASSQLAMVQNGLSVLIGAIGDKEAQAQMLGEVIATGAVGVPVLDKLAVHGGDTFVAGINPEEMKALRDSLTKPPRDRLGLIVSMLTAAQQDSHEQPKPHEVPRDALNTRRFTFEDVIKDEESPSGDGPDSEQLSSSADGPQTPAHRTPRVVLLDKSLDPSLRVAAAIALAGGALTDLATMLRGNENEKEVAAVALNKLGADPKMVRQVHAQMKMLESDHPGVRRTAESIRRGIEEGGKDWSGSQRHQTDFASIGDGWLSRAIASCDRPAILSAAFGRERYAIPMAMRQLALMRSKRLSRG